MFTITIVTAALAVLTASSAVSFALMVRPR